VDQQLRVISTQLLSCLTEAVTGNPNPPANIGYRVEYTPPEELWPEDLCCEGLAYVAYGDNWPSVTSFPEADFVQQVRGGCYPPAWGAQFKLGIMRCTSMSMQPSQTVQDENYFQDLDDSQALRQAVCCFRNYFKSEPQWLGWDVVIQRQQKTVLGGCKDRYVELAVQFPNCDCSG